MYQEVFLLCSGGPVFLLCFWDPKVDKLMKISQNMMKIGQNMMKFDENQWFWVEKYDFGVKKNEFPGQKKDFYDDLGVKISKKNEILKKCWILKILVPKKLFFHQDFHDDNHFGWNPQNKG